MLFFTSGSTGKSKGVMLSHRINYLRTHPGSQLEPRGAMLCMYPLFHMGAWTLALQAWQTQTTIVFSSADAPSLVRASAEWKPTHFNAIPAVWRRILDHVAADGRLLAIVVAAHRRLRHLGDAARTAGGHQGGGAECHRARVLRRDRVGARCTLLAPRGHGAQARFVRRASALVEVASAADTGEMLVRGP